MDRTTACSRYIVSTPYNLLLAAAIAAYMDTAGLKELIVSSHFRDADRFVTALKRWKLNPFSKIMEVKERKDPDVLRKILTIRANLQEIKKLMGEHPAGNAFISNIEQPEGQMVAYENHVRGGKNTYVEEGVDSYTERKFNEPIYIKLAKKLLYGPWFLRVETQVEYPYFDRIMVLRPDLVPKRPQNAEIMKIPGDVFAKLKRDGLVSLILEQYGADAALECEAMVLAPYSGQAEQMGYEKTIKIYQEIMRTLAGKGIKTLVKYHPRENKEDILGIAGMKWVATVHPSLTAELLFLNWKPGSKRIVIGDLTTALCSSMLINPDVRAISIMHLVGFKDTIELETLFKKCGVVCPRTMEELIAMLD